MIWHNFILRSLITSSMSLNCSDICSKIPIPCLNLIFSIVILLYAFCSITSPVPISDAFRPFKNFLKIGSGFYYRLLDSRHVNDDPLTVCPDCQTETLRKVYLPVGIVFKGKGFYATDNRSPSGLETRVTDDQSTGEVDSSPVEKKESKKGKKKEKPKAKSK